MKIKKNDIVKILIGKNRGKTGKVLSVLHPSSSIKTILFLFKFKYIICLNLKYKHLKPKKSGEKGQRIMFPAPINISNVQIICPNCGKPTRIEFKMHEKKSEISREKKNRVCKKCKANF